MEHVTRIFIIFILLFAIDVSLLGYAKKFKPNIRSKYYKWHKEKGFTKIALFKLGVATLVLYASYTSPLSGAFDGGFLMLYAVIIVYFIRDLLKRHSAEEKYGGHDTSNMNVF